MSSFKQYYRELYRTFGYPLTERAGTSSKVLAVAEKRLGVKIPAALRDYYVVAGSDRRFKCHITKRCARPRRQVAFSVCQASPAAAAGEL